MSSKQIYRFSCTLSDKAMSAILINYTEPYQIDFRNNMATQSKPKIIFDFINIGFPMHFSSSYMPDLKPKEYSMNRILKAKLEKYPAMSEKAFHALEEFLLLDQGSKVYRFYFEQKPFSIIVPPTLMSDDLERSAENYENALKNLPENWSYFRLHSQDRYLCTTQKFVDRVSQDHLKGASFS